MLYQFEVNKLCCAILVTLSISNNDIQIMSNKKDKINIQLSSLARGLPLKLQLMRYTAKPSRDNIRMIFGLLLFPSAFAHCLRNGSEVSFANGDLIMTPGSMPCVQSHAYAHIEL